MAEATTLFGMDIDQVARDAELVFEGRVINSETRQDPNSGIVSTYITFSIVDVIKGDYNGSSLELRFMGGSFNGEITEVSGLTIPGLGEEGIYFVEALDRNLVNPLLGWSQGHFIIEEDGGERLIRTTDLNPVVDVQPVSRIPASIKKSQALIEGKSDVAAGVSVDYSQLSTASGLSVSEFKARIRALIEN
ncbi:MAG: hypothetical protein RL120_06900 [Gammaproteobacteria bacterium]